MAFISRPGKEGNATTYQGKVAAGYTTILAQEVDADFDAIYSAWNAGVDTVNIKDGSITGAKLAPGAVGSRELQDGSIQTVDIGDGQVTTPKLADGAVATGKLADGAVTDAKVTAVSWGKITGGNVASGVPITPRAVVAAAPGYVELECNVPASDQYDNTKPTWLIRGNYTSDQFEVWRAPPPGTALSIVFAVNASGQSNVTLTAGAVGRTQLAVNAPNSPVVLALTPATFILSTANVWTTVITLPSLTTRGGLVHLHANHGLSGSGPLSATPCNQRWLRDGSAFASAPFTIAQASSGVVPIPGLNVIDAVCPAGAHVYSFQVLAAPGCTITGPPSTDGYFQAVEIG